MDVDIELPAPLQHQEPIYNSPAKRKVARAGRRGGKTRVAFTSAIAGHGPDNPATGAPLLEGVMQGWDVVWIAQDYPNLITVVWNEIIEPRFAHLPFVETNENQHRLEFPNLGSLYLRSAEAIAGVRGIGDRLKGVIIDEAAWLDLEDALKNVILPALLDNDGWLIIMSTTNGGLDGNAAKRIPSYFNVICEEIRAGKRSADWAEFTFSAADNPRITASAFQAFVNEYEPGSVSLRQEVYAELLVGGAGVAFPSITKDRHLVEPFPVPRNWRTFGAFDWGYNHPFAFGLFATDEDGNVYLVDSARGRHLEPPEQAERIRETCARAKLAVPRVTYAGHDCWAVRRARGENVPTIAEHFAEQGIILDRASIDRIQGAQNVRRYLRWKFRDEATGDERERPPRFRIMATESNLAVFECLSTRVNDPDHLEDVLKTDAGENGLGGDDSYDMVRYGLASRPIPGREPEGAVESAFAPAVLAHEANASRLVTSGKPRKRGETEGSDPHFGGY